MTTYSGVESHEENRKAKGRPDRLSDKGLRVNSLLARSFPKNTSREVGDVRKGSEGRCVTMPSK